MSLTFAGAPLASRPPEDVNYRIEGPKHLLYFHEFPRRVRAVFGGAVVADTVRGRLLHESNLLPVLYFPREDVESAYLEPSEHATHCPFKGDAAYWSLRVGERVAENAAWAYPQPHEGAAWLDGYVAFYWPSLDRWLDEDEEVEGHLRDPYHRVDVRETSRPVRVLVDGEVVAETARAMLLSETGLPNRFYIPPEDVRRELLEPSDTRTVCPYKGRASYWSLRLDGRSVEDAAWSYPEPLENAVKAGGHLCFDPRKVRVELDGQQHD